MGAPQYGTPPPPPGYGGPPQGYGAPAPGYGAPVPGYGGPGGYGGGMASLPTADVGKRIVAGLVDWVISVGIYLVLGFIPTILLSLIRLRPLMPLFWLVGLVAAFMYKPYYEATKDGQTIGKKMQAIKVIKQDGSPCDWSAALLRQLLWWLLGWIELIVLLIQSDRMRVGDMLAKTKVVDVSGAGAAYPGYSQPGYVAQPQPAPPVPQQPPVPQAPAVPQQPAMPPQPQPPAPPPQAPPPQAPPTPPQVPPPPQAPPPQG